jgi:hypothetical protein
MDLMMALMAEVEVTAMMAWVLEKASHSGGSGDLLFEGDGTAYPVVACGVQHLTPLEAKGIREIETSDAVGSL